MAFTEADLQSAAQKLATLDFTPAELEAVAATIRGTGKPTPSAAAEVSGFVFEPNDEPLWAKGFLPAVAGLVHKGGTGFTATDDLAKVVATREGGTI